MTTVSVIIPAHAGSANLAWAIESVLHQTFRDFELLVIDDGSDDSVAQTVMQYPDARLLRVLQSHPGRAAACNAGIRRARGKFLAFLEADDLWVADKLERHVQHLEHSPNVGVSFSASAYIDRDGAALGHFRQPQLYGITAQDILMDNPVGNVSAPVVRTSTMRAVAYYPEGNLHADLCFFDERFSPSDAIDCWTRIALGTDWSIEGIGLPLTQQRVQPGMLASVAGAGAIRSNL